MIKNKVREMKIGLRVIKDRNIYVLSSFYLIQRQMQQISNIINYEWLNADKKGRTNFTCRYPGSFIMPMINHNKCEVQKIIIVSFATLVYSKQNSLLLKNFSNLGTVIYIRKLNTLCFYTYARPCRGAVHVTTFYKIVN